MLHCQEWFVQALVSNMALAAFPLLHLGLVAGAVSYVAPPASATSCSRDSCAEACSSSN